MPGFRNCPNLGGQYGRRPDDLVKLKKGILGNNNFVESFCFFKYENLHLDFNYTPNLLAWDFTRKQT